MGYTPRQLWWKLVFSGTPVQLPFTKTKHRSTGNGHDVLRNGYRYDRYMDSVGYTAGGINDYDGDYYKSHWNRSGVAEGDCNMCHYPEYDFKERNAHLAKWNFRWMATAGSGLARVDASVKDNTQKSLVYDLRKFDNEGKLSFLNQMKQN